MRKTTLFVLANLAITVVLVRAADLLQPVTTLSVHAVKSFIAKDRFKVDTSRNAKVRIGYLSNNFKQFFLGKTERNIPSSELTAYTLTKDSLDASILTELDDRAETTLANLWELLSNQANGQTGPLLTNGYANIFYIKDINGDLWAVRASWHALYGGWYVYASSVEYPGRWNQGSQVFSRK